MAEQADVYVKNVLPDNINFIRYAQDGSRDLEDTIASGDRKRIYMVSPEVSLDICAPPGMDTKDCPLKILSDVDLTVLHSRTNSTWNIGIKSNDLPTDAPTTVNVSVGAEEPD